MSKEPFSDYAAIDAVNWSTLSAMRRSPLHYRHRLDNPRADTDALRIGRAVHTAVFEPNRFALDYALEPDFGDCRKTDVTTTEQGRENKLARGAWRAENTGRCLLTNAEHTKALAMRDAIWRHHDAAEYLARGQAEHTLTWTDVATGLACKGRLDFVSESRPAILDLKSSSDILLERFSRSVLRYGYHTQAAFYSRGWHLRHGIELPSVLLAVESAPPHDVGVFRVTDETLELGAEECRELLAKLRLHRDIGTWPGQYPIEMPIGVPPWAFGDDDVSELGLED